MIDKRTVEHIAMLSRLRLSEKEFELYSRQLADILAYIEKLNRLDTSTAPPTSHALPALKNVFREDTLRPSLETGQVLKNAPERKDDFFKIPKVIEGK